MRELSGRAVDALAVIEDARAWKLESDSKAKG